MRSHGKTRDCSPKEGRGGLIDDASAQEVAELLGRLPLKLKVLGCANYPEINHPENQGKSPA